VATSNVDVVRQIFAAFEQRDPDLIMSVCRADMVFEPVTAQIATVGEPYRGRDGMRRYLEDVASVWQELRLAPEEFHEADGGVVVATGRVYAWGAGRVIDAPTGWLWRIEDGMITYGRVFPTAAAALEAAGLSAEGSSPQGSTTG
jgi:ketosteroid isomerase-like protein